MFLKDVKVAMVLVGWLVGFGFLACPKLETVALLLHTVLSSQTLSFPNKIS